MSAFAQLRTACVGSVAAKIISVSVLVTGVILGSSLVYPHISARHMAEAFVTEHATDIANSYFDGLNKAMLTAHMDRPDVSKHK